jgi:ATP-dependent DNA ligase
LDGQLYVFDMWELAGKSFKNVPLVKRRESLKRKLGAFGFPEWVKLTPQYDAQTWETHWNSLVLERGFEGLVFKRNDVVLANAIWGRMKRTVTVDYVCLGGNPGGGRYAGKACSSVKGGLLVDGKVVPIASVSGLNDLLRVELFEGQHVGRVFEAEGKGVYANGALRHPNFVRWRDDKMPEECVMPTSTM